MRIAFEQNKGEAIFDVIHVSITATGNLISGRSRSRRPAMAAAAGKPLSIATGASASSAVKSFDFSADSPSRLILSPDQIGRCSEALSVFKDKKFRNPEEINREFKILQVLSLARSLAISLCG
ncbi:unnamed protein product [Ilex paraguariensis]|uniref:Uncharacterized protein n=1 Tax=Ilex paraguariensis TaxID=185542 RepID=A0ABC8R7D9_9AQUA